MGFSIKYYWLRGVFRVETGEIVCFSVVCWFWNDTMPCGFLSELWVLSAELVGWICLSGLLLGWHDTDVNSCISVPCFSSLLWRPSWRWWPWCLTCFLSLCFPDCFLWVQIVYHIHCIYLIFQVKLFKKLTRHTRHLLCDCLKFSLSVEGTFAHHVEKNHVADKNPLWNEMNTNHTRISERFSFALFILQLLYTICV